MQRYQLVPVSEPSFTQQIYEQHGARGRAPSDSPEAGNLSIPNNGTIYVTSQHPNATENGLRFAAGPDVRFEDEAYARYEYQHGQHHPNPHNAHSGSNEDIKIELIRNQHALHGKVQTTFFYSNTMEKTTNIPSEKRITYDSNVYMKTDSH